MKRGVTTIVYVFRQDSAFHNCHTVSRQVITAVKTEVLTLAKRRRNRASSRRRGGSESQLG